MHDKYAVHFVSRVSHIIHAKGREKVPVDFTIYVAERGGINVVFLKQPYPVMDVCISLRDAPSQRQLPQAFKHTVLETEQEPSKS
jgi:hypothetical protein